MAPVPNDREKLFDDPPLQNNGLSSQRQLPSTLPLSQQDDEIQPEQSPGRSQHHLTLSQGRTGNFSHFNATDQPNLSTKFDEMIDCFEYSRASNEKRFIIT